MYIHIHIYTYIYIHYICNHENNSFHDCTYILHIQRKIEILHHAFQDFLISSIFSNLKQK